MAVIFQRITKLLPIAAPHAGGCPAALLEQAIRLAAIEMCERAHCWRESITFEAGTAQTASLIPSQAVIHEIEAATVDGQPVEPVAYAGTLGDDAPGPPRFITQINETGLILHPWPAGSYTATIKVSMFLKPRIDTRELVDPISPMADPMDVLPGFMIQQYGETLCYGGLARVLRMEGETWFSPARADTYAALFNDRVATIAVRRARGQQDTAMRTRPAWM